MTKPVEEDEATLRLKSKLFKKRVSERKKAVKKDSLEEQEEPELSVERRVT